MYNKPNLCNNKKIEIFVIWIFRILKCVTKRECVTLKVRKDPKVTVYQNIDCIIFFNYVYSSMNHRIIL